MVLGGGDTVTGNPGELLDRCWPQPRLLRAVAQLPEFVTPPAGNRAPRVHGAYVGPGTVDLGPGHRDRYRVPDARHARRCRPGLPGAVAQLPPTVIRPPAGHPTVSEQRAGALATHRYSHGVGDTEDDHWYYTIARQPPADHQAVDAHRARATPTDADRDDRVKTSDLLGSLEVPQGGSPTPARHAAVPVDGTRRVLPGGDRRHVRQSRDPLGGGHRLGRSVTELPRFTVSPARHATVAMNRAGVSRSGGDGDRVVESRNRACQILGEEVPLAQLAQAAGPPAGDRATGVQGAHVDLYCHR